MKCLGMLRRIESGKAKPTDHPCGKCMPCRINSREEYATKFVMAFRYSNGRGFFSTHTYADIVLDSIPDNRDIKKHMVLFNKSFRKAVNKKFGKTELIIGYNFEYGEDEGSTHRPHFHRFCFNWPGTQAEFQYFCDKYWHYGLVHVEAINGEAALGNYIAKHAVDLSDNKGDVRGFGVKPYRVSPRNMGDQYIERFKDWHNSDLERVNVPKPFSGGKFMRMPREWKDKIWTKEDRIRQRSILNSIAVQKEQEKSLEQQRFEASDVYEKEARRERQALTLKNLRRKGKRL